MNQKFIISHRGAIEFETENTIKAFKKSIELGADMIEFDVRKTKDNIFVIHHNKKIGTQNINALTFDEINKISRKKGYEIPALDEVIILSKGKIKLDVEMKEQGYENRIAELLLKNFKPDEFIISSFSDVSITFIKEFFSEVKVGLLLENNRKNRAVNLKEYEQIILKYDYLLPHIKLLNQNFFEYAKEINKPLIPWSVNSKSEIIELLNENQIHGIITDKTNIAMNCRKELERNRVGA